MPNSHSPQEHKTSQNVRSAQPLPPEFELPHTPAVPETSNQAGKASSGGISSDASVASGLLQMADKDEYLDEP